MTIYKIAANTLRALVSFSSEDASRTTITVVRFDAPRSSIVATDGARMVRLHMEPTHKDPGAPAFSVHRDVLLSAIKAAGKGGDVEICRSWPTESPSLSIIATPRKGIAVKLFADEHRDEFPEWPNVMPKPTGDERPANHWINPEFLVDMAELARSLAPGKASPTVRLAWCADEMSPVLYRVNGTSGADVVIMPMRAP